MKRLSQQYLLRSAASATLSLGAANTINFSTIHLSLRHAGSQRRIVRPTEDDVADLMDDETHDSDSGYAHTRGSAPATATRRAAESPVLSSLVASASFYQQTALETKTAKRRSVLQRRDDARDDDDDDAEEHLNELNKGKGDGNNEKRGDLRSEATHDEAEGAGLNSKLRDFEGQKAEADEEAEETRIAEQQRYFYEMPVQALTDRICAYLRTTDNPALVSAQEEHLIFPVLLDRLPEFHVSQLLDIMECHWSRSTMLRYGTVFKDMVRDRIAQLATAAATKLETTSRSSHSSSGFAGQRQPGGASSGSFHTPEGRANEGGDPLPDDDLASAVEDEAIFVQDTKTAQPGTPAAQPADSILDHADREITAATIYRALVVTGMAAGHRKRDLAFFQLLGNYFTFFINEYTDPHDLVRVMTALARAKIVPSPAFLNLLARRLPVLHKRVPLEPVSAYRAMSNFARMGHTSMNTFRFLADCTYSHMEKNIREERRLLRKLRSAASTTTESAAASSDVDVAGEDGMKTTAGGRSPPSAAAEMSTRATQRSISGAPPAVTATFLAQAAQLRPELATKERLRRLCGLKPSSLTRLLLILARLNAPHQQYLRPLIHPILVPMIPYFPPPSFTRLMQAVQHFQSNDAALIEAFVAHVCDELAPAGHLTRADTLELLRLLAKEDTPIPTNLDRFLRVACDLLKSATSTGTTITTADAAAADGEHDQQEASPSLKSENVKKQVPSATSPAAGSVTVLLRPQHMNRVVQSLGMFQRKIEIPLETLQPLTELVEDFAKHMAFLMELSVVSLPQVEEFVELCVRHQVPDPSGAIEQLAMRQREFVSRAPQQKPTSADVAAVDGGIEDGEGDYYGQLDVDVREVFLKILTVNDFNTYGGYRPVPGPLQVDFRDELTKVTAFELLQSVDLFNKAFPGALKKAPQLYLSRSLLEKVGKEGEVVVEEETNRLVIRQPRAELLTREDLVTFVELVQRTPLEAIRNAPAMWVFIKEKAERLHVAPVLETATQRLQELRV